MRREEEEGMEEGWVSGGAEAVDDEPDVLCREQAQVLAVSVGCQLGGEGGMAGYPVHQSVHCRMGREVGGVHLCQFLLAHRHNLNVVFTVVHYSKWFLRVKLCVKNCICNDFVGVLLANSLEIS